MQIVELFFANFRGKPPIHKKHDFLILSIQKEPSPTNSKSAPICEICGQPRRRPDQSMADRYRPAFAFLHASTASANFSTFGPKSPDHVT
jgi:hypothetical protein